MVPIYTSLHNVQKWGSCTLYTPSNWDTWNKKYFWVIICFHWYHFICTHVDVLGELPVAKPLVYERFLPKARHTCTSILYTCTTCMCKHHLLFGNNQVTHGPILWESAALISLQNPSTKARHWKQKIHHRWHYIIENIWGSSVVQALLLLYRNHFDSDFLLE